MQIYILEKRLNQGYKVDRENQQLNFVLYRLQKNGVKADITTHSLLFSKNVLQNQIDQANLNLLEVNKLGTFTHHREIQTHILQSFFEQSLKRDNFAGLAQLANFVEKYDVDISSFDMSKFRPALDFYLNHTFDLNKILTFSRFYIHYANSAL